MVGLHTPIIPTPFTEFYFVSSVLARVTLTQHFANTNRTDIPGQAEYVFPVPVGGAVCGFEMHTADGKTIVGKVKEALQAQAEFKEAVADNRNAGLLAKAAPDGTNSVTAKGALLTYTDSLHGGVRCHTPQTSY